ncbi:TPA: hypothetical protein N0F65_002236 [Lagenidium giganteum]|uniref:MATE efflux family protein n=1 Tax=Lagenidium giganteum TaxID=4803 RepID=A0AAV2YWQ1_9STRA|nr:TPA: hypothetical protein N0F65_002236 [Lagenidium giganteum]
MPALVHELRALARLALPSALSNYCFFAVSITELSVMGRLGVDQLAAVAYSQMAMDFSCLILMQGFNAGMNALCSQAFGAKNYRLLGEYTQLTGLVQTIMCLPMALVWWRLGDLLVVAGVSDVVCDYARVYCRLSIVSLWPRTMFQVLATFYQSQEVVLPTAWINAGAVVFNFVLATGLTYGKLGLPAAGFYGCPIGSAIAMTLRLVFYVWYMNWKKYDTVGMPLALGNLFEDAQLQLLALFSAHIGEVQLGSHNSMMELFFFLSSPLYGIMSGAVTRMGNHLGANNPKAAHLAAQATGVSIACLCAVNIVVILASRTHLGRIFSPDPLVIDTFSRISLLGAFAYFILSFFYYAVTVLEAQARSTPVMVAYTAGAWMIGVPVAYYLGLGRAHSSFIGIWIGMLCGYAVSSAIGFYVACFQSDWEEEAKKAVARSLLDAEQDDEEHPLLIKNI